MRLLIACAFSALIVLASPFMGQLQSLLRSSVSTRTYVLLLGGVVIGSIAAAVAAAFIRIKGHRGKRIAAMAAAIGVGLAYTTNLSTGDATIDAVERVHFIEYGLIAVLFYRVWRRAGDPSTMVLPLLCGFIVGTLDEWLQWFIPYRVGEMHDVFLNLTALACGVLFGIALEPPPTFTLRSHGRAPARIGVAAAAAVLVLAAFVSSVHLGYTHDIDGIGQFQSQHTVEELNALQADRAQRWLTQPPIGISRLSREDQYLDEGFWHVRERNLRWDEGDISAAWHENLILERFFTPVLDSPTYASKTGTRWPPEHRSDAQARQPSTAAPFVSTAAPRPIYTWPKVVYWPAMVLLALLLLTPAIVARQSTPRPTR
jgi:VanZ family protein